MMRAACVFPYFPMRRVASSQEVSPERLRTFPSHVPIPRSRPRCFRARHSERGEQVVFCARSGPQDPCSRSRPQERKPLARRFWTSRRRSSSERGYQAVVSPRSGHERRARRPQAGAFLGSGQKRTRGGRYYVFSLWINNYGLPSSTYFSSTPNPAHLSWSKNLLRTSPAYFSVVTVNHRVCGDLRHQRCV